MIPKFDENGNLPPGIHPARMTEIRRRFAHGTRRAILFDGLLRLARHLKAAGCKTLYLNGSFITVKPEPQDYDAVWEYEGVDHTIDPLLRAGWDRDKIKQKYKGDVFCRMPEILGRDHVIFFQTDRNGVAKGILKIDLGRVL